MAKNPRSLDMPKEEIRKYAMKLEFREKVRKEVPKEKKKVEH